MDANTLIAEIRKHPDFEHAGMILCHNGVVRATSRDGRPVFGLRVHVDHRRLESVLEEQRRTPGIVDIRVWIAAERDLAVGDDVMLLAVAGDVRENVIGVLHATLDAIKSSATSKTEFFSPPPAGAGRLPT